MITMALEAIRFPKNIDPDILISVDDLMHNPKDAGWHFGSGEPVFFRFKDQLVKSGGSVLDLGIGWGRSSLMFAMWGMNVSGYELNSYYAELARSIAEFLKLNIEVYEEDFTRADIGENNFDIVILNRVLNHFPSRDLALLTIKRAYRALKPGGFIYADGLSIEDNSYDELESYAVYYPYEVRKVNEHVFTAPCSCSGEQIIEPHLYLEPTDLLNVLNLEEARIVYSLTIPTENHSNVMYGKDWPRMKPGKYAGLQILGQRLK